MEPSPEVRDRVQRFIHNADLSWVAETLTERRDDVLGRWLEAAAEQPFHSGRRQRAVSDHIPDLFDALVDLLRRAAPEHVDPAAPLDDPQVLAAAQIHARMRFEQGLQATEIVTEFRLLRHEIGWALRSSLSDQSPTTDVIGAELIIHDALDGAISLALGVLTKRIEELREEVLATIVHDVLQPITSIRGSLQLAQRSLSGPSPNAGRILDALNRATEATQQVVQRLTLLSDASRLALGHFELQLTSVDMVALVRSAVGRLDPHNALRVRMHVSDQVDGTGRWDPIALDRVIDNLLSNAIKYSPSGTPIVVAISGDAEAVQLTVQDQGVGLSERDLAQLFQRYHRIADAANPGVEGHGLGLYLARGIVTAHDGRIWAESDGPGSGASFHVRLPRAALPTPATH